MDKVKGLSLEAALFYYMYAYPHLQESFQCTGGYVSLTTPRVKSYSEKRTVKSPWRKVENLGTYLC